MLAEKSDTSIIMRDSETAGHKDSGLQKKLVGAARHLINERGFGQTTMAMLAKKTGMTVREAEGYYPSVREICHDVILSYQEEMAAQFEKYSHSNNPRQRLSHYLDSLADNADELMARGCPITNLYFDLKREDRDLARQATRLLLQRYNWISDQFVLITRVENNDELPERLLSAIHGISILAQASGNARLIRNQVNQLKSWIRSM